MHTETQSMEVNEQPQAIEAEASEPSDLALKEAHSKLCTRVEELEFQLKAIKREIEKLS